MNTRGPLSDREILLLLANNGELHHEQLRFVGGPEQDATLLLDALVASGLLRAHLLEHLRAAGR